MIDKVAKGKQRAPRKDREQEAIVSLKDDMNERMSGILGRMTELRKLLKQIKSGWNGGPVPDIGMGDKVNLTDPLPDMVAATGQASLQQMVELTKELNAIIQELRQVDSMQDNYAAARAQRITERAKQMQQIQQQAAVREEFIKVASNPLTRVWTYILAPFSSEKGKWQRVNYLRALARIDRNLKQVQDRVLSGDPSILDALEIANELYIDAKSGFFDDFRNNLEDMLKSGVTEVSKLKDELNNVQVPKGEESPLVSTVQMPGISSSPSVGNISTTPPAVSPSISTPAPAVTTPLVSKVQMPTGVPPSEKKERKSKTPAVPVAPNPPAGQEEVEITDPTSPVENTPPPVPAAATPISTPQDDKASDSLMSFIFEKYTELKDPVLESWSNVNSFHSANELPEIWKDILLDKFTNVRKSYAFLKSLGELGKSDKGVPSDRLYKAYVYGIQCLVEFLVYYKQFLTEQKAAEIKGSFTFGSTINDEKIQESIKKILNPYIVNINKFMTIASFAQDGIVIYGGNGVTRWFNRMKTHLSSKRDANVRLRADRSITRARDGLQKLMDNLEQRNINFRSLIQQSDVFYDAMIDLYDKLADLGTMYNSRMRMQKSNLRVKKDWMPYDFIPVSDINQMRNIKRLLEKDKESITYLKQVEELTINLQRKIEQSGELNMLEGLGE